MRMNTKTINFQGKNGVFSIQAGDITKTKADVIVCPSNPRLEAGFGISGAIYRYGGAEIFKEAELLVEKRVIEKGVDPDYAMQEGSAHFTTAGNLAAKYVSHVVCTTASKEKGMYSTKEMIVDSVINTLKEADKRNQTSVALPLLGTGFGRLDTITAASAIASASVGYLDNQAKSVKEVILVVLENAFEIAKQVVILRN